MGQDFFDFFLIISFDPFRANAKTRADRIPQSVLYPRRLPSLVPSFCFDIIDTSSWIRQCRAIDLFPHYRPTCTKGSAPALVAQDKPYPPAGISCSTPAGALLFPQKALLQNRHSAFFFHRKPQAFPLPPVCRLLPRTIRDPLSVRSNFVS